MEQYPQDENGSGRDDPRQQEGRHRWGPALVIAIAVAFVVVMVLLHLTGVVGPGAH